uniref:Uncharacterized protein n=1 Tax=Arundo donax TaxID=35708 RepID=A0A0A9BFG6_ARUDO
MPGTRMKHKLSNHPSLNQNLTTHSGSKHTLVEPASSTARAATLQL